MSPIMNGRHLSDPYRRSYLHLTDPKIPSQKTYDHVMSGKKIKKDFGQCIASDLTDIPLLDVHALARPFPCPL